MPFSTNDHLAIGVCWYLGPGSAKYHNFKGFLSELVIKGLTLGSPSIKLEKQFQFQGLKYIFYEFK